MRPVPSFDRRAIAGVAGGLAGILLAAIGLGVVAARLSPASPLLAAAVVFTTVGFTGGLLAEPALRRASRGRRGADQGGGERRA